MKKLINKIAHKIYLKTLKKGSWKEGTEVVFTIDGHDYHRYKDSGKIPLKRQERTQQLIIMMEKKLDKSEWDELFDITEGYIQHAIDSLKSTGKLEGLQNAIYSLTELKSRKDDLIFHPSLMMEIAAVTLIRDDENPEIINELIISEKKDMFEKRYSENEIGFFLECGLAELLPNKDELLTESKRQLEVIRAMQEQYGLTKEIIAKKQSVYDTIRGKMKSTSLVKS